MAATIRDIKDRTGLSLATISKYLNGGNVLPENRQKIEAAIKELHYEVNEIARGLVTNKTHTIGVVVFSIESLFNGILLRYIGEVLRRNGYGLLICDSCYDEKIEADNIRFLLGKKVDGMIVLPVSHSSEFLQPAKHRDIPIVLLDRTIEGAGCDCVKIDNRVVAKKATKYLIEKNHRKIAIICSKIEYTGIERYKGFVDAMNEEGLGIVDEYCQQGNHALKHGYDSMKTLLSLEDRPTAVLMTNYEITLGAFMALRETDFRCPEDISMMGFDNLLLNNLMEPQLCLVVQPMQEFAEKAAELLLKRIEGNTDAPVELVLDTIVEEGNSVRSI